jgi:hypothetical protein
MTQYKTSLKMTAQDKVGRDRERQPRRECLNKDMKGRGLKADESRSDKNESLIKVWAVQAQKKTADDADIIDLVNWITSSVIVIQ